MPEAKVTRAHRAARGGIDGDGGDDDGDDGDASGRSDGDTSAAPPAVLQHACSKSNARTEQRAVASTETAVRRR